LQEAIQIDGDILYQVLKEKSSVSYKHLVRQLFPPCRIIGVFQKKHCVDPVLYMIEWFMCVFCRTLPWPTVVRVWDMFFCEGIHFSVYQMHIHGY
jgi:hypothetical protein